MQLNVEQQRLDDSVLMLKGLIEQRAREMGISFQEELKNFLTLDVSKTLRPQIRERLVSEVET